jgi:RimJ/RimL family protein N-acetyltransferase
MRVIVDYGFREMGLHRIQLSVAPFNPAGIRAYQKAGFVEEGRYRESVLHDGRWYDAVLMSILDHEWAARRSPGQFRFIEMESRTDAGAGLGTSGGEL